MKLYEYLEDIVPIESVASWLGAVHEEGWEHVTTFPATHESNRIPGTISVTHVMIVVRREAMVH